MSGAIIVGVLVAGGVYLMLQRGLIRMVIGLVLLQHGINVLVVLAGGIHRRGIPIAGAPGDGSDPLVQAFVLTAIVIGLATTIFLVTLAFVEGRRGADIEEGR